MIGKTNALSAAGVELSLVVSVTSGAAVTATKSGKTVTGTAAGGSCVLKLPEAGTWSVSATLNGQTSNTQSVSVKDSYAVSLTFFSATITVTVDSGASVALKKDGVTVQTKTSTGTAVFTVTETGTYTIVATKSGQSVSGTVNVVSSTTTYALTLSFVSPTLNNNEYIVIHYFGSLGTAAAVANYFNTPGIQASAHYCLDEGSTVYQCVEDNNIAWHCGTSGAYVHPRCRNENSIGIEVRPYKLDKSTARSAAPADWYFPPEIVDNLVVFTQMLMQKYNVPLENVVRHYDVTGKWCPRPWMGDDTNTYYGTSGNEQWKKFKERLSGEELDMNIEEARKQLTSCADTGDTPSEWARDAAEFCKRKGIFNGDGAGNYGWQQPITREAVAQILYNAFESAGMLGAIPDKK